MAASRAKAGGTPDRNYGQGTGSFARMDSVSTVVTQHLPLQPGNSVTLWYVVYV